MRVELVTWHHIAIEKSRLLWGWGPAIQRFQNRRFHKSDIFHLLRLGTEFFRRQKVASFLLRLRPSLDAAVTAWLGFGRLGGGNADDVGRRRDVQPAADAAAMSGLKADVGCWQYDTCACGGSRRCGWEDLYCASWCSLFSSRLGSCPSSYFFWIICNIGFNVYRFNREGMLLLVLNYCY